MIADLNPVLRGWGNYFRTGNAADRFNQIDRYVTWRLSACWSSARAATSRGAGERWTRHWFVGSDSTS